MPIVTSQIVGQINKPNGRRKLLMQATDQTGKIWEHRPNVPAGNDDAATLAAWVVDLDADLANLEAQAESNRALDSEGSPAEHQTQAELDKATISLLMQIEDSLEFSRTLPWFREFEIRGGNNAGGRANYLGVTSQQYGLVAARYNQITGVKSGLEADALRVWTQGVGW